MWLARLACPPPPPLLPSLECVKLTTHPPMVHPTSPVFESIAKAGIALHSFDAHGHGLSEPLDKPSRALIWDFQWMVWVGCGGGGFCACMETPNLSS